MSKLIKFIFENMPIRGQIVKIDAGWEDLLKCQQSPLPHSVQQLLGEMSAAATLMQSNIKFNGAVVLQIFGDSALKVAVVEVQPNLSFRATANIVGEIDSEATLAQMTNQKQQGRCAITLDPIEKMPGQQPYQGIISLDCGEDITSSQQLDLAQVLENYMHHSEQLDTVLVLAANQTTVAGLIIQRMPDSSQNTDAEQKQQYDEDFNRVNMLTKSLTKQELLELDPSAILQRLFWQEQVRVFEQEDKIPHFACTCNREKVGKMLLSLGEKEADEILQQYNSIDVNCDFCGQLYQFDVVDVKQLFADTIAMQVNNNQLPQSSH